MEYARPPMIIPWPTSMVWKFTIPLIFIRLCRQCMLFWHIVSSRDTTTPERTHELLPKRRSKKRPLFLSYARHWNGWIKREPLHSFVMALSKHPFRFRNWIVILTQWPTLFLGGESGRVIVSSFSSPSACIGLSTILPFRRSGPSASPSILLWGREKQNIIFKRPVQQWL